MSEPTPTLFEHLRSVLLLIHVIAVVGMSIPSPEGFSTQTGRAKIETQLKQWEVVASKIGVSKTIFREVVFTGGTLLESTEDQVERLFKPYSQYLGVRQSWRMFSTSPNKRWKMEVWIEQNQEWRRIYRPYSANEQWMAPLLEDGRVRGMLNALGQESQQKNWEALARSLARRAAIDFPDATMLKIHQVPVKIPNPEQLRNQTEGKLEESPPRREAIAPITRIPT